MSERLLNIKEVCSRLGIGRTTFFAHSGVYMADGLEEVLVLGAGKRLFREASVDALIAKASRTGNAIGDMARCRAIGSSDNKRFDKHVK